MADEGLDPAQDTATGPALYKCLHQMPGLHVPVSLELIEGTPRDEAQNRPFLQVLDGLAKLLEQGRENPSSLRIEESSVPKKSGTSLLSLSVVSDASARDRLSEVIKHDSALRKREQAAAPKEQPHPICGRWPGIST